RRMLRHSTTETPARERADRASRRSVPLPCAGVHLLRLVRHGRLCQWRRRSLGRGAPAQPPHQTPAPEGRRGVRAVTYLTPRDVAAELRCSVAHARRVILKLTHFRDGRVIRVARETFNEYLAACLSTAAAASGTH